MPIKELGVFPQFTVSEGQGFVGTRQWSIDHGDDVETFVQLVCNSHWPNKPDVIPISVQCGKFFEDSNMRRPLADPNRYLSTMGELPQYGSYRVVAQYALHKMTNCWPEKIPKPWHPPGTTLTLQTRGAGQVLIVSPAGMLPSPRPFTDCANAVPTTALSALSATIIVPVTEYHITCDLMTLDQVNVALSTLKEDEPSQWDLFDGCVNDGDFLGAPPGTVLMDGFEIGESFACSYFNPNRYRMTVCFKVRIITNDDGSVREDYIGPSSWSPDDVSNPANYLPVGWNHDFINLGDGEGKETKGWGWRTVMMRDGSNDCSFRYPFINFSKIFGNDVDQECDVHGQKGAVLADSFLCNSEFLSEIPQSEMSSQHSFNGGSIDPGEDPSNQE